MALLNPFTRINDKLPLLSFDCGDSDLNEFLITDALKWQENLLAVTYCLENGEDIALYFSLSNDKISANTLPQSFWRKIKKNSITISTVATILLLRLVVLLSVTSIVTNQSIGELKQWTSLNGGWLQKTRPDVVFLRLMLIHLPYHFIKRMDLNFLEHLKNNYTIIF